MEAALVNAPVTHIVGERSSHDVPEDEPELFAESVRALMAECLARSDDA